MKKDARLIFLSKTLGVLSIPFFAKALSLNRIVPDGDGIGVYFWIFEINDRVPNNQISTYRNSFFLIGIMISVIGLLAYLAALKRQTE